MTKLAIVMGLLAACSRLLAQQVVDMHASIPFAFRMGDRVIHSGTYLIQASERSIVVREEGGRLVAAALMTIPETRGVPHANGELVFKRYGEEYFLSDVWTPYSTQGCKLWMSKQEKLVASRVKAIAASASIRTK
jgi:hypothetical protein